MVPSINIHSSVAVYVQIENHVQFAIASGRLKPGDQLPTVRDLSEKLEVNVNTVAKSYRDLEVMGLLYARQGMGVFIRENAAAKCAEECRKKVASRIYEVVAEANVSGMARKDIADIIESCLGMDATPYRGTPDKLLEMAKLPVKTVK